MKGQNLITHNTYNENMKDSPQKEHAKAAVATKIVHAITCSHSMEILTRIVR